jgi:spermidine/putrescine transport system permease protein
MKIKTIKQYQHLKPFFVGMPGIVWQVLFFYVPLLCIIALSFSGTTWLSNFVPFMRSSYFMVIGRSLLLATLNATLCTLIAYPLAYFLAFRAGRFKSILLFLVILPFWNNFLVHIYAWTFVLDHQGIINTVLLNLHLIQEPIHFLNSFPAVLLMMVYFYMPFMILPLYAALERFDRRLIEASLDLGATWWGTIRHVLIPLSMPGIRTGFFLVFIPSFGEFIIPEFMGGNKNMYVGTVVSDFILGTQTIGQGAAFTIISSCMLIVAAGLLYLFLSRSKFLNKG